MSAPYPDIPNGDKIGLIVKSMRQHANLSVSELSERTEIDTYIIKGIESNQQMPTLIELITIAKTCDLTITLSAEPLRPSDSSHKSFRIKLTSN
jgi:transcriptional regulator with XRE-family HTH domain